MFSCGLWFQTLCWCSRNTNNWTSSSSSYHQVSWQLWNGNSDTIHDLACTHVLDSHLPRTGPLRGRGTPPRTRPNPTSKELLRESVIAKGNESSATELNQSRKEEIHATQELDPADPVYNVKEDYSYERKEVDWNSRQQILQDCFSRNFKIGHETGTSFWSSWKRRSIGIR